jgi:hypothetical protein
VRHGEEDQIENMLLFDWVGVVVFIVVSLLEKLTSEISVGQPNYFVGRVLYLSQRLNFILRRAVRLLGSFVFARVDCEKRVNF